MALSQLYVTYEREACIQGHPALIQRALRAESREANVVQRLQTTGSGKLRGTGKRADRTELAWADARSCVSTLAAAADAAAAAAARAASTASAAGDTAAAAAVAPAVSAARCWGLGAVNVARLPPSRNTARCSSLSCSGRYVERTHG